MGGVQMSNSDQGPWLACRARVNAFLSHWIRRHLGIVIRYAERKAAHFNVMVAAISILLAIASIAFSYVLFVLSQDNSTILSSIDSIPKKVVEIFRSMPERENRAETTEQKKTLVAPAAPSPRLALPEPTPQPVLPEPKPSPPPAPSLSLPILPNPETGRSRLDELLVAKSEWRLHGVRANPNALALLRSVSDRDAAAFADGKKQRGWKSKPPRMF